VVTTGSLAQASQDLNISPSAASRLLSLLEAELKLNLFSRSKRRLELSEEGDRFYRQTEHILRGLDEMELVASEIRSQANELLSLVTAAPLAMGLISPTLALMQQRETLECVINVETRFDLESKVATRAYNVGIISLPIENAILDLTIEPFLEARLGVLMRHDHPLAEQASISVHDLSRHPIVALTKGQRWRERLDDVFSASGIVPEVRLETTSTPVVKSLVRDGAGVAVADAICGRITDNEPLRLLPLMPEKWITYATIHPNGPRPARSGRFIEAMRDFIRSEISRNPGCEPMLRLV
jgi:DNA-binding transcriptional LysR family regulator